MPNVINNKSKVTKKSKPNPELEKLVSTINKKFGDNAVTLGVPKNLDGSVDEIQRIPTGSISLDIALGGGIPVGRYTEISGAFSVSKTSQALHIIAQAQKQGLVCALVDVEGTSDTKFLRAFGIDVDNLVYTRPSSMEEALQVLVDLQTSGIVNLAVLDSIAAVMASDKEMNSTMEDTVRMGIPQQLFGEYFRKFQMHNNSLVRQGITPFTVIGLNQLREKIGAYGDPEYTPGGRAKGFAASVDIRLRRGDWIKEGKGADEEIVGQVVKFRIEKNKTFKRMQVGEFDYYYSENNAGVNKFFNDNIKEVIMCAVEWGVIERAGAWFRYKDNKYQGLAGAVEALKKNPEIIDELKQEVLNIVRKV